jgi:hypothetical protein
MWLHIDIDVWHHATFVKKEASELRMGLRDATRPYALPQVGVVQVDIPGEASGLDSVCW